MYASWFINRGSCENRVTERLSGDRVRAWIDFQEKCLSITLKEEQSSTQPPNRNLLLGPCVCCSPTLPCLILIQPQSLFCVGSGRAGSSQRLIHGLWQEGRNSMAYSEKWKVWVWLEHRVSVNSRVRQGQPVTECFLVAVLKQFGLRTCWHP